MSDPAPSHATVSESLVARAQEGDGEAFDLLFAAAAERAQLFIRLRMGPKLRGELESLDVLQEAYHEALRGFDRFEFRDDGSFARWLCRIIENRIRGLADHFQAAKRQAKGDREALSGLLERAATRTGPATMARRHEGSEKLAAAMTTLEPDEREVLLLRFFQDRTLDEIADLTGHSATGVRRLVGRATLRLGRRLGEPSE